MTSLQNRREHEIKKCCRFREVISESRFVVQNFKEQKNKWKELFGNNNPIHIEIGMGKGRFIMDMARLHPEINYIGIEKYSSVLIRGIQKMEAEELRIFILSVWMRKKL